MAISLIELVLKAHELKYRQPVAFCGKLAFGNLAAQAGPGAQRDDPNVVKTAQISLLNEPTFTDNEIRLAPMTSVVGKQRFVEVVEIRPQMEFSLAEGAEATSLGLPVAEPVKP